MRKKDNQIQIQQAKIKDFTQLKNIKQANDLNVTENFSLAPNFYSKEATQEFMEMCSSVNQKLFDEVKQENTNLRQGLS